MAFVGVAIAGIGAAIGSLGIVGQILVRLAVSIAASALMQALAPKPRPPGIKTEVTQTGGGNPLSFILGTYATAGARICPPMSHGQAGKTPNAYLTEVIELGCVAGQTLLRVIINDEYVTLGTTPHADYGLPVTGNLAGYAWVKYYDGSQTAADPMLLAKYGSYPERPWTSDMIGRGLCYAILTFRYKPKLFQGLPRFRFEMGSIPLYDPRKDTTVGGAGAHRWANKATWEQTVNPMVMTYNIKRGIGMLDGSVWGGRYDAADLPLASWFAAMNECDLTVSDGAAGTEPQFRAGFEVTVDEPPADVVAELLKVCSGQVAEVGGSWKTRVGPPGTPLYTFADGDILITEAQDYSPFPSFTDRFNGVHAAYPDPASLWQDKEAPPLYNATYEAADQGQRLVANLNLPACPYGAQVRRLQSAYMAEERRFRRHTQTFPVDTALLEPLDATAWNSTYNGYTAKIFELAEILEDPMTGWRRMSLRERDAADYSYPAGLVAPTAPSTASVVPAAQSVPGFDVAGDYVPDATGAARRPALKLIWDGEQDDATGITWEIRLTATGVVIARGSTHEVATGEIAIAEGILPSTAYEARAKLITERDMIWTAWDAATTPATPPVTRADIANGAVSDQFQSIALGPYTGASLPTGSTVLTLDMGVLPNGEGWRRFFHFDARSPSLIAGLQRVSLQTRKAVLGGAMGAWIEQTWWDTFTTSWDVFSDGGGISQPADDFEYRVVVTHAVTGANQYLRNVYLTVARITK